MDQTCEHLRLLSIFHYVVAGIIGLFSLLPLIHVGIGLMFLLAPEMMHDGKSPADEFGAKFVGTLFTVIGSVAILIGMSIAILIFVAGRKLAARRHHTFCLVIAAVECLFAPLGTVLGVFTILVLMKPEARELFGLPPIPPSTV